MADSLVLKGVKDVRKHTGEMQLVIPVVVVIHIKSTVVAQWS